MKYDKRKYNNAPVEEAVEDVVAVDEAVEAAVAEEPVEEVTEEVIEPVEEEVVEEKIEEVVEEAPKAKKYVVDTARLNGRKAADKNSDAVKVLEGKTIIEITKIVNNPDEWVDYGFVPSMNLYVNMNFVKEV